MNEAEERLLTHMKELTLTKGHRWGACFSEEDMERAEAMIGFPLSPLLRRIYLEVGNKAFGLSPLYEISRDQAMPLVESYVGLRSEPGGGENGDKPWPEKLLIIYDHGCNTYSCLDCAHPEYRVLECYGDVTCFAVEAPSFQQWLEGLLDGGVWLDWDAAEKVFF